MLERDGARLEGERGALGRLDRAGTGRIAETELKIIQINEDLRTDVGKGSRRNPRQEIRAGRKAGGGRGPAQAHRSHRPQDGKIFQRSVHTVGGVIQAGEVVMLVVPTATP